MMPHWLFYTQNQWLHFACGACLEVHASSVGIWMKSNLLRFCEGQTSFSISSAYQIVFDPQWTDIRMFYVETSTLPPSMHLKLIEHGWVLYAKQPTSDNSLVSKMFWLSSMVGEYRLMSWQPHERCLRQNVWCHLSPLNLISINHWSHLLSKPKLMATTNDLLCGGFIAGLSKLGA